METEKIHLTKEHETYLTTVYGKALDNLVRGGEIDITRELSPQPAFVVARSYGNQGFDYDDTEMACDLCSVSPQESGAAAF